MFILSTTQLELLTRPLVRRPIYDEAVFGRAERPPMRLEPPLAGPLMPEPDSRNRPACTPRRQTLRAVD